MLALELRLRGRSGLQVRPACATNRLQTAADVYSFVKLLGFEQAIVRGIKIFALDVKTCQGETLAGSFFSLFMRGADLAQTLAQLDRAAVNFKRRSQSFYCTVRRLVLHEELGVEQGRFNIADVLSLHPNWEFTTPK